MKQKFKPEGYNSASPYFVIDGAEKLIALLKQIFDAKELRRYDMPDGTIMHAEVRIDDSVIMMGNSSDQFPPNKLLVHVYVRDVDKVYARAIAAGCKEIEKPKQRENDPDKRGSFEDFGGNVWSIATQMERDDQQ